MKVQVPVQSDQGARVIKFTPRTLSTAPVQRDAGQAAFDGQPAEYARQRTVSDQDDFHHRMLTNLAAFVFAAGLTAAGIWLATSLAELQQTQDCALAGHPNCVPLVPSRGGPV